MRKSLIMGTREDVIKRRAKQSARLKPVMTNEQLQEFIDAGLKKSKARIVTFNHPCIK
ncbi:hypothetical protein [Escherichia coli]|uniref:hypothetical protein n=1 Tax=Escherichia coli TaxID=562 RepID=UPI001F4A70BC|nr:hypothetical protein [Escherichia coli]